MYCRVCKLAGKNDSVVRSYNIGDCFFFTSQDQADLVARLNTAQLEYKVDTGEHSPYYDFGEEDAWLTGGSAGHYDRKFGITGVIPVKEAVAENSLIEINNQEPYHPVLNTISPVPGQS